MSIAAARERATIGEISCALEKVFGRYQENLNITKGVYKKSFSDHIKIDDIKESINKFSNDIRNLVSYFDASMDYTKFPKLYEIPIHTTFMANINSTKNTKKQKDNQFIKYLEKLMLK